MINPASPASVSHPPSIDHGGEIEWRQIPGLDGYEASSTGEIRSVDRVIVQMRGGQPVEVRRRGQLLAPSPNESGYLHVMPSSQTKKLHVLVAAAFLGPRPAGQEVRHLDGDPLNNAASNLAYGTKSENELDKVRLGTHHEARKTQCVRGHALAEPNLVPSGLARGWRLCLACSRACKFVRNRLVRSGEVHDVDAVAHKYYAELMSAPSA